MKQEAFEAQYGETWSTFEEWIALLTDRRSRRRADPDVLADIARDFPARYRQICHHLSLARARRYSFSLQQRLNQLALDGHQHLYRGRIPFLTTALRFVVHDFPAAFRQRWAFMLASAILFYAPAIGMAVAIQLEPDIIYSVMGPGEVSMMEEMYDPENRSLGRERDSDSDLTMFGFYIYNNISIGFQTFAGGLLFGLGSVFYLAFNGLVLGAVASHLTAAGFTETFWSFVAGHSSFELTAIMIFGGIGLAIGYAALAPGRKRRWHAIRDMAIDGMPLVYGGTMMLVFAAFVEAYWSSTTWPPVTVKYTIGIVLWLLHFAYFGLLGRNEP
jgi:uncharacterized membrane protein SpoIIM required for sporulation